MSVYVLVHGSWHSASSWARVVPLLEAQGHRVFTPTLTGHGEKVHLMTPEVGLETHVIDVIGLVLAEDLSDVVLVGHSYGGVVISQVADAIPERIRHLVYIDAIVPENGESAVDVMPTVFQPLIDRVAESAVPWLIPPPPVSPAGLFGITDPDDVAWVRSTLSGQAVRSWTQPVLLENPAADAISRTHIHCARHPRAADRRPVPPVQPNGTPADVREIDSGHDCMIIAPAALTRMLLDLQPTHQKEHSR